MSENEIVEASNSQPQPHQLNHRWGRIILVGIFFILLFVGGMSVYAFPEIGSYATKALLGIAGHPSENSEIQFSVGDDLQQRWAATSTSQETKGVGRTSGAVEATPSFPKITEENVMEIYETSCAALFPRWELGDYTHPPNMYANDTDQTTNNRVSAVQYLLQEEGEASVAITGVFDAETQRAVASAQVDATKDSSPPLQAITNKKTGEVILPDPPGVLGPYGYVLLALKCGFYQLYKAEKMKTAQ